MENRLIAGFLEETVLVLSNQDIHTKQGAILALESLKMQLGVDIWFRTIVFQLARNRPCRDQQRKDGDQWYQVIKAMGMAYASFFTLGRDTIVWYRNWLPDHPQRSKYDL